MPPASLARRRRPVPDRRPRWRDIPEEPEPEDEPDYDRIGMMMKIDTLDRDWRDLVNEHGFTPVVQCWQRTNDPAEAARMLKRRHEMRQRQLAHGSY